MKACHCRAFNETAASKAIEENNLKHAEDIHENVCGMEPKCGACLGDLQCLADEFQKTGTIKELKSIPQESRDEAARKLGHRFTKEEAENDNETPLFKRRYIRMLKKEP